MPFKSENQRRWMHLHHPEIAGDWEKKYKDGGFVEDSKEANKEGDVVNAKLAIGELILNGKHLEKVEQMTGVPAEQFWAEVGVPGFEGGQNPLEARGGGVASKKDYLMKYQDSGVAGDELDPSTIREMGNIPVAGQGGGSEDVLYGFKTKSGDPRYVHRNIKFPSQYTDQDRYLFDKKKELQKQIMQEPTFSDTLEYSPDLWRGVPDVRRKDSKAKFRYGGTAKKEHLMGYENGGTIGGIEYGSSFTPVKPSLLEQTKREFLHKFIKPNIQKKFDENQGKLFSLGRQLITADEDTPEGIKMRELYKKHDALDKKYGKQLRWYEFNPTVKKD